MKPSPTFWFLRQTTTNTQLFYTTNRHDPLAIDTQAGRQVVMVAQSLARFYDYVQCDEILILPHLILRQRPLDLRSVMLIMKLAVFLTIFCFCRIVTAQPCVPEPGGICLTKAEKEKVVAAIQELDKIKNSPAEVIISDPIILVRDWEDRVYVNGGEKKPVKLKLKIADVIDRDLEMTVPIEVGFREKPPDPLFRFRVRAQLGLYFPEMIQTIRDTANKTEDPFKQFWTASIGFDFFHYEIFNISALLGVDAIGGSLGVDITKNFGIYTGPVVKYDGWKASLDTGVYFAFN